MRTKLENKTHEYKTRILRVKEVTAICGLSATSIWRLEKNGKFPTKVDLGAKSSGWVEEEVFLWLEERIKARKLKYQQKKKLVLMEITD